MKLRWIVIAVATLIAVSSSLAADPALAGAKHKAQRRCVERPYEFSWGQLLSNRPEPQPNGCSPPVYAFGKFVGQDPDANIRFQLKRDPATGYSAHNND